MEHDRFLSSDCTFLEMSVLHSEKGSLEDFRRRKVSQLKEFLRNRVLKKTGANRDQGRTCCVGFRRGARPFPILLVKCWKVAHWNAKELLTLPKIQTVAT